MGPFQLLFMIHASHPYFADRQCRSMRWEPAVQTRKAMADLGLLFRTTPSSIAIYYDPDRMDALKMFAFQKPFNEAGFFFKVYAQDPFFMNYTEWPETWGPQPLYLNTSRSTAVAPNGYRLDISLQGGRPDAPESAALPDKGILTHQDLGTPPICIVHIPLTGAPPCPLNASGHVHGRVYHLAFDQRRTFWKYFIMGPLAKKPVTIGDKANRYNFNPTSVRELQTSLPALAFISDAPIAIEQTSKADFQLRLKTSDGDKVIIKRLPTAPIQILHREKRATEEVFISEIFIHS